MRGIQECGQWMIQESILTIGDTIEDKSAHRTMMGTFAAGNSLVKEDLWLFD
jgi:hypothetical protein